MTGRDFEFQFVHAELVKDPVYFCNKPVQNVADAVALMSDILAKSTRECSWCLYLDGSLLPLSAMRLSEGDAAHVLIPIRSVIQGAMLSNAEFIYIIHNHPSGPVVSSPSDLEAARKINRICVELGICLVDFLVTGIDDKSLEPTIYSCAAKKKYRPTLTQKECVRLIKKETIKEILTGKYGPFELPTELLSDALLFTGFTAIPTDKQ